jgi:tripartite-type tricarboxylate transporter receptor subunit TctC
MMANIKMTHVPHKSVAAALTSLAGGHIELSFNVAATTLPHIQSGRIRALAVTSATRVDTLPDLPTIAEAGVPGYENSTWNAIAVPAGTPRPIIATLNREIAAILKGPDVREAMHHQGAIVTGGTPEQFTAQLKAEFAKYGKLIKQANIKYE